jgi:hypothetical protein
LDDQWRGRTGRQEKRLFFGTSYIGVIITTIS